MKRAKMPPAPRGLRTIHGRCSVDFSTAAVAPNGQQITTPGLHAFALGDGSVRFVVVAGGGPLAICDVVVPGPLATEFAGVLQRMEKFSHEGKANGIACGIPSWGREQATAAGAAGVAAILGTAASDAAALFREDGDVDAPPPATPDEAG